MISGSNNNLDVSFQFSKPSADNNSSSSSVSSYVYNIECSSISAGVNLLNSYISKKINLAHCKIIVFSEEFASIGISEQIYTLENNIEIRPDTLVVISKCSAKDFIENSKPDLESSVSQYYEITPKSKEYTGYTDYVTIDNFYNKYIR